MSPLLVPLMLISALIVLAVLPSATRRTRRARLVLAYLLLHPVCTALMIGCKYLYLSECSLDITWRTAGGWIVWGSLFALAYISLLEFLWRHLFRNHVASIWYGTGDDPEMNRIWQKAFLFLGAPSVMLIAIILLFG